MRRLVAFVAFSLWACGGGGAGSGPSAVGVNAEFTLSCTPDSFDGRSCGSAVCTIGTRGGFASDVAMRCADAPDGVTCGFGSNPVRTSQGSPRVGLTISVDPARFAGNAALRVIATGGGIERDAVVRIQGAGALPGEPGRGMLLYGCAGYRAGIPNRDSPQQFGGVFVGAWRGPTRTGFCGQTLGGADGSFALAISRDCVFEGADVHLTAGGLSTCVTVPFRRGTTAFVEIFGQSVDVQCPTP